MSRTEALAEAARIRLRPILMTTATMTFGMLPLALKLEPGAESRAPMAVVVIGGLLSSTLLAIFVTPALYTLLDDLQNLVFRTPPTPVLAVERVPVPAPAAVPVAAGAGATVVAHSTGSGNGHGNGSGNGSGNGHGNGANGHKAEPAWLQRLKAGRFEDD